MERQRETKIGKAGMNPRAERAKPRWGLTANQPEGLRPFSPTALVSCYARTAVPYQIRRTSMVRCFTLQYWIDEDWYVGWLKEVPCVFSQGASLRELEENIRDAYQLMMEEDEEVLIQAEVDTKEIEVEM